MGILEFVGGEPGPRVFGLEAIHRKEEEEEKRAGLVPSSQCAFFLGPNGRRGIKHRDSGRRAHRTRGGARGGRPRWLRSRERRRTGVDERSIFFKYAKIAYLSGSWDYLKESIFFLRIGKDCVSSH